MFDRRLACGGLPKLIAIATRLKVLRARNVREVIVSQILVRFLIVGAGIGFHVSAVIHRRAGDIPLLNAPGRAANP